MKKTLLLFLLFPTLIFSQRWKQLLEEPNPNFNTVSDAFYSDWQAGMDKRSYGYKHFKRLEHHLKPRVFPSGEIKRFSQLAHKARLSANASRASGNDNWEPLGPNNWLVRDGYNPGNGRVNSIAIHPTNNQIIYIATAGGGVWKTTNGGIDWTPLSDNLPILEASDIIINPFNPNEIIFTSGDNDSFKESIGVFKSNDAGLTWSNVLPFNAAFNVKIGSIAYLPNNPNHVLLTCSLGTYRSTDGGDNWSKINNENLYNFRFKSTDGATVYATTTSEIKKSVDTGRTFNTVQSFSGATRLEIETTVLQPNYLYVLVSDANETFGGLFLSKNEGASFNQMSSTPNILDYAQDGSGFSGQGEYDLALTINPINPSELTVGGINTWKSTDTGKTWVNTSYWFYSSATLEKYNHADIHFLRYFGNQLYCGSDGGIFLSNNGGIDWLNISMPLNIAEVYDFEVYKVNTSIISLGTQDNGSFLKQGAWQSIYGADGFNSLIDQSNPNNVIFSSQFGSFYKTTDGGFTSNVLFNTFQSGESGNWQTPLQGSVNLDTLLVGYERIWSSINGGANWNPMGNTLISSFAIDKMAVAPSDLTRVYATDYNQIYRADLNYSTNGSVQTNITSGLPFGFISNITVHPTNKDILWITISGTSAVNKIFKSVDAGASWINLSTGLPNIPANCVAYSNKKNGLYLGTDAGVYYMDDSITAWEPYFTGLPNAVVTKIIVDEVNGKVKASTYGRGIWESDGYYGAVVGLEEFKIDPNSISLYPNPSNDMITISYNSKPNGIKVLDVSGRIIDNINQIEDKNTSHNLSSYNKGVYFVQLDYGTRGIAVKKVIRN